jgi:hypothetical protein
MVLYLEIVLEYLGDIFDKLKILSELSDRKRYVYWAWEETANIDVGMPNVIRVASVCMQF